MPAYVDSPARALVDAGQAVDADYQDVITQRAADRTRAHQLVRMLLGDPECDLPIVEKHACPDLHLVDETVVIDGEPLAIPEARLVLNDDLLPGFDAGGPSGQRSQPDLRPAQVPSTATIAPVRSQWSRIRRSTLPWSSSVP